MGRIQVKAVNGNEASHVGWFLKPENLRKHYLIILPLIFSQLCQRVFHIIDNRFIEKLGHEILYIHNLQYTFIILGQLIGVAGATAGLVLWNSTEKQGRKRSVLFQLMTMTGAATCVFVIPIAILLPWILQFFAIPAALRHLASSYIHIGLLNMMLYSVYLCLDGLLIATRRQNWSLIVSASLTAVNLLADFSVIHFYFSGIQDGVQAAFTPLCLVGGSTTMILSIAILFITRLILKDAEGPVRFSFRDFWPVWGGELGISIVRAIGPLLYPFQFALMFGAAEFLNTYNIALHLAFLCCLPLTAGTQIAVRDASLTAAGSGFTETNFIGWWAPFFYTGFLPTYFLLFLAASLPREALQLVYGYLPPPSHQRFLPIFFFACMVGQTGHIFSVKIRALRHSVLVTRNFIVSQIGVQFTLFQALIYWHKASPAAVGLAIMASSVTYSGLNMITNRSLGKNAQTKSMAAIAV